MTEQLHRYQLSGLILERLGCEAERCIPWSVPASKLGELAAVPVLLSLGRSAPSRTTGLNAQVVSKARAVARGHAVGATRIVRQRVMRVMLHQMSLPGKT